MRIEILEDFDIDYEMQTTFWQDFTVADRFGASAVNDTYKRAFKEWKNNHIYLTELVMVLNWKLWEHYRKNNTQIAELYDKLWRECDTYAYNNLKGAELEYFMSTTD